MTQKRDFAELIEVLSEHKKEYRSLLALSLGQRRAFEAGGPPALMKIIVLKDKVIETLRATDARLTPYTARWEETMRALPEQARREVADLIGETAVLVEELIVSERAMESVIAEAKTATAGRAKAVSDGRAAAIAYKPPALAAAGRLLDREG